MVTWLSDSSDALLVTLERDGHTESLHRGVVCVVDSSGQKLFERGDAGAIIYPRSSVKPLQALAVLETGVELSELEMALSSASHMGSARHREAISEFLAHHVLSPGLLQCPPDWPAGSSEKVQMMAAGETGPTAIAMNCSGKHAGFLAACQHRGDDLESYLDLQHPLQRSILLTIERYAGERVAHTGIDGCGAPLHAISLGGLATALSRVLSDESETAQKLVRAIEAHPWAIAGEGHPNTRLIEALGGITKGGAEGVLVVALPSGVSAAVKISDGNARANTAVALEALQRVGALEGALVTSLREELDEKVWGGGRIRGEMRVHLED